MDFLTLCRTRSSVRDFKPQLPSAEALAYVEECVRLAPSACNRQPWLFLRVTDEARLKALRESYARPWFATAPAVYVALCDTRSAWVRPCDGHPHGDVDLSIATEHLVLAAAEQGLGTCWVCNFDVELLRTALALEPYMMPVALIPIGYPADSYTDPGRHRKAAEEIFA